MTTNHVGTNLFCTAGIRFLKSRLPHTELDVVAMSRRGASVFAHNPDIRKVHLCVWKWQVSRLVNRYDLVLGLRHGVAKSYLDGGPHTVILAPPAPDRHRAEDLLQSLGSWLGCSVTPADRHYQLYPQPHDFAGITRQLGRHTQGPVRFGLHLGGGRTAAHGWKFWYADRDKDPRLWPLAHYVTLAARLCATHPHVQVVLTGSRNERFLGRRFTHQAPNVTNLIGQTSLLELAALMSRLAVFVTQDTGALHVACTTDVPLVGLFGPTHPHQTGPYPQRPQQTVLHKTRVEDIHPEEVYGAVLSHLAMKGAVRGAKS